MSHIIIKHNTDKNIIILRNGFFRQHLCMYIYLDIKLFICINLYVLIIYINKFLKI